MSDREAGGVPHPRQTTSLYGHEAAERQFLDAYRGGRLPHAWLIAGPQGIGKATLAYRIARYVLTHPDPAAESIRHDDTLFVDGEHLVARRVAGQGHSDLLVFERTVGDNGKLRTVIAIDQIRRAVKFFGSTAGEGGWRVCIVDSAEDLNREGANALLKILEEPPRRSLLLVVSHAPGRLLPTIRSRCRRLALQPLAAADVVSAAADALGIEKSSPELQAASALAEDNVAKAIALCDADVLALRRRLTALLDALPSTDPQALHALGDSLARDEAALAAFVDTVRGWAATQMTELTETRQLARLAVATTKFNRSVADADIFNLDRKPLVFSAFGLLAEARRG